MNYQKQLFYDFLSTRRPTGCGQMSHPILCLERGWENLQPMRIVGAIGNPYLMKQLGGETPKRGS